MLASECVPCHQLLHGFQNALNSTGNEVLRATTRKPDPIIEFAQSVAKGMRERPRRMECRFLYDARGSELYERICQQPEYYPTRTEASILAQHAGAVRNLTGPVTLLELGAGSAVKTRSLLEAYSQRNEFACYVPIDVSEKALRLAGDAIGREHPDVQIISIHGTYQDAIPLFATASPALVIFLGSSIGNFTEREMTTFWHWMAAHLSPGDFFLLGVDLVKDAAILEAAYNDAAGVTASFTKNFFVRMNRELGSALDISSLEHVARYESAADQIEIHVRFNKAQTVRIKDLAQSFAVEAGEEILIEISRKFRLEKIVPLLETFGFTARQTFTDKKEWFGLLLLQKT